MKTCPFCAEEIKDAAIVCRYCGRDLPVEGESKSPLTKTRLSVTKRQLSSVWAQGAKISFVITFLASIAIFTKYQTAPTELLGNILFGLPVTFVIWWVLVTGFISLWQKSVKVFFLVLGGVGLLITAFFIFPRETTNPNNSIVVMQTHTPATMPSATLSPAESLRLTTIAYQPGITEATLIAQSNCVFLSQLTSNDVGKKLCIKGKVLKHGEDSLGFCWSTFGDEKINTSVPGCYPLNETVCLWSEIRYVRNGTFEILPSVSAPCPP